MADLYAKGGDKAISLKIDHFLIKACVQWYISIKDLNPLYTSDAYKRRANYE